MFSPAIREIETNGLMIPTPGHPFFGYIVHEVSEMASQLNYDALINQSTESQEFEEKEIDTFIRVYVYGILVSLAKNTTFFNSSC